MGKTTLEYLPEIQKQVTIYYRALLIIALGIALFIWGSISNDQENQIIIID